MVPLQAPDRRHRLVVEQVRDMHHRTRKGGGRPQSGGPRLLREQAGAATSAAGRHPSSSVVRVSDLFDEAGVRGRRARRGAVAGLADRGRAGALAAIARQFGVDWLSPRQPTARPSTAPAGCCRGRRCSSRSARPWQAQAPSARHDLPGFKPPMIPLEGQPHPRRATRLHSTRGRFRGARRHVRWDGAVAAAGVRPFRGNRGSRLPGPPRPPGGVVLPEVSLASGSSDLWPAARSCCCPQQAVGLAVRHPANPDSLWRWPNSSGRCWWPKARG